MNHSTESIVGDHDNLFAARVFGHEKVGRLNVSVAHVTGVHVRDAANHLGKVELRVFLIESATLLEQLAEASRVGQLHKVITKAKYSVKLFAHFLTCMNMYSVWLTR